MYSIKAVTALTGLNAETLRAWERRYRAVIPKRDLNERRIYSHEDIERLTLLNNARKEGHAISKLAVMTNNQLHALLKKQNDSIATDIEVMFLQVVDALMHYRLDRCEDLLRRGILAMDMLSYAQDFLMPLLHKIGDLWHQGRLSIAQEHLFSNCVKRIVLSLVHNMQPFSGNKSKILFATPVHEQHEFGILLSCLVAATQGNPCFYLGSNLPASELINVQKELEADLVVISVTNQPVNELTLNEIIFLSENLKEKTQIWIGGSGANTIFNTSEINDNFKYIENLDGFNKQLTIFNGQTY